MVFRAVCWGCLCMYDVYVQVHHTAGGYTKKEFKHWSPAVLYPAEGTSISQMAQGDTSAKADWPWQHRMGNHSAELRNPKSPSPIHGNLPWGHMPSLGTHLPGNFFSLLNMPGKTKELGHSLNWVMGISNLKPLTCMTWTYMELFPPKKYETALETCRDHRGEESCIPVSVGPGAISDMGSADKHSMECSQAGIKIDSKQAIFLSFSCKSNDSNSILWLWS